MHRFTLTRPALSNADNARAFWCRLIPQVESLEFDTSTSLDRVTPAKYHNMTPTCSDLPGNWDALLIQCKGIGPRTNCRFSFRCEGSTKPDLPHTKRCVGISLSWVGTYINYKTSNKTINKKDRVRTGAQVLVHWRAGLGTLARRLSGRYLLSKCPQPSAT